MKTMEQRVNDLSERSLIASSDEEMQLILVQASDLFEENRSNKDHKSFQKIASILSSIMDDMLEYVDFPEDYFIKI